MKNKEKFAKEILNIVCKGGAVALNIYTAGLQECSHSCHNCLFFERNYPKGMRTPSCRENFVHWASSEYKENKEFSEADKAYVRVMDKLNWFARDEDRQVYGYVSKPFKRDSVWDSKATSEYECDVERVSDFTSATFEPLSWDDEEPVHRSEILGE